MEVLVKKEGGHILIRETWKKSVVDYVVANDKAKENVLIIGKGDRT